MIARKSPRTRYLTPHVDRIRSVYLTFGLGFGAKGAEGDPKPQMHKQGFGAKGAEGDPKPQMLNQGFGAKGAEGDPKPQMHNQGGTL